MTSKPFRAHTVRSIVQADLTSRYLEGAEGEVESESDGARGAGETIGAHRLASRKRSGHTQAKSLMSARRVQRFPSNSREAAPLWEPWPMAVIVGAMLAVGSTHLVPALLVALASGAVGTFYAIRRGPERGAVLLCQVTAALGAYCALQVIPFPAWVTTRVAPAAAAVWRDAMHVIGAPDRSYLPLSLDPGGSLVEAAKWLGYAGIAAVGAVSARRYGIHPTMRAIFISGVLCALLAMAHLAAGATKLYGLYEPQMAVTPWRVAPLLNPNNFAGYLNFAALVGFGLLLQQGSLLQRGLVGVGLSLLLAISLLTGSRGGIATLFVGLIGILFVVRGQAARGRGGLAGRVARYGPIAIVLSGATVFAILGNNDSSRNALSEESFQKLSLSVWALPLVRDHAFFGIGRGAFETIFPEYRQVGGRVLYQFPENIVTQWFSEWGIIVGGAALLLVALVLSPRRIRPAREAARGCAYVAVLTLLAHNLVDLSLELSGVATAWFAMIGALAATGAELPGHKAGPRWNPRIVWLSYGACVVLVAGLAAVYGRPTAVEDRARLHAAYEAADLTIAEQRRAFTDGVKQALARRPGDPYPPLLAALAAMSGNENALPWLNQAIRRDPQRGLPYLISGGMFLNLGVKEQALSLVRVALTREPQLADRAAKLLLPHVRTVDEALRAAPEGPRALGLLTALAANVGESSGPLSSEALIREAIRKDPSAGRPRLMLATFLLSNLEGQGRQRCREERRAACLQELQAHLAWLKAQQVSPVETTLLEARRLSLMQQFADAEALLARRCAELDAPLSCWRARVIAAFRGSRGHLDEAITAYMGHACVAAQSCGAAAFTIGNLFASEQDWLGAMKFYGRAVQEHPTRGAWERLSEAAKRAGQPVRARDAKAQSLASPKEP